MKNNKFLNSIITGDSLEVMKSIENNSIDVVLTDPPYFLDKMDEEWSYEKVSNKKNQQTIKSLPAGMKFDKEQGRRFYDWYLKVAVEVFRLIKPGGFFFSFSSPRLYHRMASAVDDAGFEIRDCFMWLYTQNQAKAMSLNHFIDKLSIDDKTKNNIKQKLGGWKTPQLKSCFEPIVMAQKPTDGTYLKNMLDHEVGLLYTETKIGEDMFPANVMSSDSISEVIDKAFLIPKPTKEERGEYNDHKTVKPLRLCEYLIKLSTFSTNSVILDPFVGSGTTAVAAKKLGRKFVGIEMNPEYVAIAKKRLGEITKSGYEPEKEIVKQGQLGMAFAQRILSVDT